jgi:septum formation protein
MQASPLLILASTSRYRRTLLERLGLPFTCHAPAVEEHPEPGEAPLALATRLARAKAAAVAREHPGAWVVGSDQVAVLGADTRTPEILGKPGTALRCVEQLQKSSGRCVVFLTAMAVLRYPPAGGVDAADRHECVDTTRVTFRRLERDTILRYVAREAPLDCAGGFKCEGLGISLFEAIETRDPSALVGLPLIGLASALRSAGFDVP